MPICQCSINETELIDSDKLSSINWSKMDTCNEKGFAENFVSKLHDVPNSFNVKNTTEINNISERSNRFIDQSTHENCRNNYCDYDLDQYPKSVSLNCNVEDTDEFVNNNLNGKTEMLSIVCEDTILGSISNVSTGSLSTISSCSGAHSTRRRSRRGAVSGEVYTEEDAASYVKKVKIGRAHV